MPSSNEPATEKLPLDMLGKEIKPGDYILYPMPRGRGSGQIIFCRVEKIAGTKKIATWENRPLPLTGIVAVEKEMPTLSVRKANYNHEDRWEVGGITRANNPEECIVVSPSFFPPELILVFENS